MRWVKRGLWVAAWGCWTWLGFALHQALPKHLGEPLRCLELGPGKHVLGFIDARRVAVRERGTFFLRRGAEHRLYYDLLDANTGASLESVPADAPEIREPLQRSIVSWQDAPRVLVPDDFYKLFPFNVSANWLTAVIREDPGGALVLRLWFVDAIMLNSWSPDGSMWVCQNGNIYAAPTVNFPLLALSQAILALPLVLTWLALRWRRKRRLRIAGPAS